MPNAAYTISIRRSGDDRPDVLIYSEDAECDRTVRQRAALPRLADLAEVIDIGRDPVRAQMPVSYSAFANSFFPDYDLPGRFFYVRYRQQF